MCDLLTGLGMLSSVAQGNAQASAYSQQAAIARQNAELANQQANQVQEAKQSEEQQLQQRKRQTIGTARASLAANGADTGVGTSLGAIQDIAYGAQQDIDNMNYNAANQQNAYMQQSNNYKNQASVYDSAASNAKMGGILGAAASYASSLTPFKSSSSAPSSGFSWDSALKTKKQQSFFPMNNFSWNSSLK